MPSRVLSTLSTLVASVPLAAASAQAPPIASPSTAVGTDATERHGVRLADPYRWLEQESAEPVRAWAAQQNELAESFAGRAQSAAIAARIASYSEFTYESAHEESGGRTWFLRGRPGSPYTGLYRTEPGGAEVHLLGPVVDQEGGAEIRSYVRRFWPSPDGAVLVVQMAQPGDSFGSLRLIDALSGVERRLLAETTHNGSATVAWLPDGRRLALTVADRADEQRPVRSRTLLVELESGRTSVLVEPIEDAPGRHRFQSVHAAPDRDRLFVELASGSSGATEVRMIELGPGATPVTRALSPAGESWQFVGARGDDGWFYTDSGAPAGRIVKVSELSGAARRSTFLAEGSGVIAAGSQVGGNAYGLFGDYLVLLVHEPDGPVLRAWDATARLHWERRIPASGSVWGGFSGDPRRPVFFYRFLGVADPATAMRVDLPARAESVRSAPELPFARESIVARRIEVIGEDGVRIPVLIAHRADLPLDRPRKLILYGYGAFGWTSFLWYQPWLAEWFLEQDGVFAVAGVRGGGEHGESWHEAGRRRNRQNAVDDYVAVAEELIRRGLTDPTRLVATSSSIGGSLAPVALEQRPELFGAALLDYPVLDLVRYTEFGQARSWIEELGDPADRDDFAVLRALSPYDNVDPAACYPPILVRPGERDPIVTKAHSYKFVARLQAPPAAPRPCARIALLDQLEGAGHDYGTTTAEISKSHAVALAFLARVLPADGDGAAAAR